jgi:hypothetical protein
LAYDFDLFDLIHDVVIQEVAERQREADIAKASRPLEVYHKVPETFYHVVVVRSHACNLSYLSGCKYDIRLLIKLPEIV